jgi:3-deoxy-D-manno-octulosonic-acid transferase
MQLSCRPSRGRPILAASLPGVDAAVYFPLDARWIVRRALAAIRPDLFIFTETELWPGFLSECACRDVPCVLVSGRVSAASVRRYAWVRPLMRNALARVICCMQSETDARHIISVGAMPGRVEVSGSPGHKPSG